MEKDNVVALSPQDRISDPLTDLLRSGAQNLIAQAVEAEVQTLLEQYHGPAHG